jgi:hypothetical protein
MLIGHTGKIQLERKSLLHAVTRVDPLHVDEVQRLLGRPDHPRVLRGDIAGHPQRRLVELISRHYLMHGPEVVQRGRVDRGGGEEQPPHHVLRYQPRQMGRRAECAAFDLGQTECRIVGGDDDVGVADQPDATTHAEAVDRSNDGHRAFVDRPESREASAVGVDECREALGALHLLDVDAGVEAAALRSKDHDVGLVVLAGLGDCVGEFEPAARRDGVDRRVVDRYRDDARLDSGGGNGHGTSWGR